MCDSANQNKANFLTDLILEPIVTPAEGARAAAADGWRIWVAHLHGRKQKGDMEET